MPLDGMKCIGGGRRYTEKKDAAAKSLSKQEREGERRTVRDIVVNHFWEFPDDKAAIGCDTGQPITMYCHINDTGT